nr:immunoglobulin heavy chain junction region [Macaca mulatta]MOW32330.1 immunoglobulin heavy chain junction region [Macaca mulatta]MOW32706.1 immunoglobulin heavy chain junction region [Macaca mulatta]MOW32854.1 immunoglobulin heavy chain junction region [Macaca mulatta]MOW33159.1 immunoglobulin heavy chain junction region [Macaca mulatta]
CARQTGSIATGQNRFDVW